MEPSAHRVARDPTGRARGCRGDRPGALRFDSVSRSGVLLPGDREGLARAIEGRLYLEAMDAGEVFFIAVGEVDGRSVVIGFASDYCIKGQKHGTSVYVRGGSARQWIR